MTKEKLLLGALSLMSLNSSAAPLTENSFSNMESQKAQQLNTVSLSSIESTWLAVPATCKARGFNASPTTLENAEASAPVQAIYASYSA